MSVSYHEVRRSKIELDHATKTLKSSFGDVECTAEEWREINEDAKFGGMQLIYEYLFRKLKTLKN